MRRASSRSGAVSPPGGGGGGSQRTSSDGRPGVAPRPERVPQQVGSHQRQPPAVDAPRDDGEADEPEERRARDAHPGGTDGGVVVETVGEGADRRHRHDLGKGQPQQDAVLGLHVGGDFVRSHG